MYADQLAAYLKRLRAMTDRDLLLEFQGQTADRARPIRQEIVQRWLAAQKSLLETDHG